MKAMSRTALGLAISIFGMAMCFPFTMEPMSAVLAPTGPGNAATFTIANDASERIALRFSVLTRSVSADGRETNAPAGDRFVIYPARLVVEPGSRAMVKLLWKGPAALGAELPFRFVAEQVALDGATAGQAGAGIKVMFRYVASIYIGLPGQAARLQPTVTGALGPHGEAGYRVEIDNSGERHVVANALSVEIRGRVGGPLAGAELGPLSGSNYLSGTGRSAFVPSAEAIPGRSYEASISFDAEF